MPDQGELIELSDVSVERIGLVRRPAGRLPSGEASTFIFVKSESGAAENEGGISMTDQATPTPVVPSTARDITATENYAEQLAQARTELEQFKAQLGRSETAREQLSEKFVAEQRRRRLNEFSDVVRGFSFADEPEKFAEDLLALEDFNADLYGRWLRRLKALDEQVKKGALFEQFSVAGGESAGKHPFETEVERVRVERFSSLPKAEGWTQAYKAVQAEKPELSTRYAYEEG